MSYTKIDELIGKTFSSVRKKNSSELIFANDDGEVIFEHIQDCCENVEIEDITGDLEDLVDTPILVAEERTQDNPDAVECGMWTFYEFRTIKGSVTVRWYGSSNGFYSVGVGWNFRPSRDFIERDKEANPDNYDYRRYQRVR